MDANRFDHLSRLLATIGTRRGLLGLLGSIPILGGLFALLGLDDEVDARGRRKRRKRRHKKRTGNHKKNRKGKRKGKHKGKKKRCTPDSAAQTCAGKCGTVSNNCQQPVDCGSCACAQPCAACQTCQEGPNAPGQCVANGAVDGQACGGVGEVCAQGNCVKTCVAPTDDLQVAVNAAAPGTTVSLCPGTWTLTSTVSIAQALTLVGAGADQTTLDGGNAVTVLGIAAGAAVTLEALTITNGSAAFGAGIFNDGTLTLREADIVGNAATSHGGGIYSNGSITLEAGSRIAGNTATNEGGGIRGNSIVTLKAGSLVGGDAPEDANSATAGGGILSSGTLILEAGSRVAGNTANNVGGGIYVLAGTATLQAGSRVDGNSAIMGGGIRNLDGTVTLESGALICDNSEPQCLAFNPITGTCPNPADGICPSP